ncbi:transposase [Mangrovicoccus sp. HB161399]|uniref:transposase n=1 Tax=Mangrovicoccus sp. HB161399 TaxID=2720392 RepID=UPI0015545803|nr:transposase [Mangrovicoccus sp. HB161399]
MEVAAADLDLARNAFQVHGIADGGNVVSSEPLRRAQLLALFERPDPCPASRRRARELSRIGREVRLIPPVHAKPCVKRGKSDAADAEAICGAVTRPALRVVQVKSAEQRAMPSQHRTREPVVRQRTQLANLRRGLPAEFGIILQQGSEKAAGLAGDAAEGGGAGQSRDRAGRHSRPLPADPVGRPSRAPA